MYSVETLALINDTSEHVKARRGTRREQRCEGDAGFRQAEDEQRTCIAGDASRELEQRGGQGVSQLVGGQGGQHDHAGQDVARRRDHRVGKQLQDDLRAQ